jgi:tripartite-type tricarboxylate transporter receptor subunit TctC
MADIKLTHIPYKGQGAYNAALASDEIQIALGTVPGFGPLTSSGRVRAFAATGLKPPKEYPGLPTVAETYPGYELEIWFSLVATAGTPADVIKRLNQETRNALTDPVVRADLDKRGMTASPSTPEELGAYIQKDLAIWKDVVKRANLSDPAEGK